MFGGDVVVLGGGNNGDAEGGDAENGGADTAVRTGGKTRAWDGCVARIDVSNLSKGRHTDEDDDTAARRRGRFGGRGSTRPEQKKFVLDEGNRWKTEARIAAGGTGGTAELERLRRAAQRLENNKESGGSNSKSLLAIDREKEEDEDAPVVVAPEELTFGDDGWATTAETARCSPCTWAGLMTPLPPTAHAAIHAASSIRSSAAAHTVSYADSHASTTAHAEGCRAGVGLHVRRTERRLMCSTAVCALVCARQTAKSSTARHPVPLPLPPHQMRSTETWSVTKSAAFRGCFPATRWPGTHLL